MMDGVPTSAWTERPDLIQVAAAWSRVRGATSPGGAAAEVGSSVVIHDLDLQMRRFAELRAEFPEGTLHAVAVKANPLVEVVRPLVTAGAGCEVASIEELHVALLAGCDATDIVFDSPAKTTDELRFALERNVMINVDNVDELDRIAALGIDSESPIGLRVNPVVGEGSIVATSVGGRGSRFGIPVDDVVAELHARGDRGARVTGLHVHVGSQGCTLAQLIDGVATVQRLRGDIDALGGRHRISCVDIGGGLPTDYAAEPSAPSIGDYVDALRGAVPELFDGSVRLVTEFGRALLAGCGTAVSRVEYLKRVDGADIAVIHLGADFLLRAAYQPHSWRHRFSVLDGDGRPKRGPTRPWTIAGPLCFAGDVIGRDVDLPDVEPEDWLVIHDVGAYTYSMWSRHCSRGMPAVVGIDGSTTRLLRAAERPEDVAAMWTSDAWRQQPDRPATGPGG